ncbi:MAG: hypothetical protein WCB68_15885 [Pyrinomonadaceae bacterium]
MKNVFCVLILALFLLSLSTPQLTTAQTGGPSASGSYKFILEDDLTKYVEFDARTDEKGTTTGQMTLNDEAKIFFQDVDGTGERSLDEPVAFYMKAELDSLTIEKNRAVMSGTIRDSSYRSYIGKWVQLVVEDNGDGREIPDKLTWCFCQPEAGGWIPSDSEVPGDRGAWMSWWATDAERKDDVGIPSPNLIPGNMRGCRIFTLASYSFVEMKAGEGAIKILP